jgi:hypothetical protein
VEYRPTARFPGRKRGRAIAYAKEASSLEARSAGIPYFYAQNALMLGLKGADGLGEAAPPPARAAQNKRAKEAKKWFFLNFI